MKIGFIGLGTMGCGMANNLLSAGRTVVVHDISKEAATPFLSLGATWAATPKTLAQACDVVFTSLPTPADVLDVCNGENGLREGFSKGDAWFDLTTNSVTVVREIHQSLIDLGVDFLDAPVSGGAIGAASGKLAIWVGGEEKVFTRFKPVLDSFADQARYIGPIGAGTIAKLVHNTASTAVSAVLTEVFTMGVKAGLDPLPLWQAVQEGGIGRMRTFEKMGTRILPGKYDKPSFELRLAHKDIQLALQLGKQFDVPLRLCGLVAQELMEAMNRGWERRDAMAFTQLQQERAAIAPFSVPIEQIKAILEKDSPAPFSYSEKKQPEPEQK